MRAVFEEEQALHPSDASVHRIILAARGDGTRLHIEETRMREGEPRLYGNRSRVNRSHTSRRSCDARVRRTFACLHMSCARVDKDMSVVH